MLVLSRKRGEKIVIGNDIVVTIVDIDRGKVRLGVVAPKEVRVDRAEIHEKIVAQQGVAQQGVVPKMRCPDCSVPGLSCDRCNGEGVVPLAMVQWIEAGKAMRARRIHHTPNPLTVAEAAAAAGITVDEYLRQERGCVPPPA